MCVCQNGIPEYAVSAVIGPERVVGAPVGWGATFSGPGVSELTTAQGRLNFTLGSLDGSVNDLVVELVSGMQEGRYQYSAENIQYFKRKGPEY